MRSLILSGSPREHGDTAALLSALKEHLPGEIVEVNAYRANIAPCVDCRRCWTEPGCVIRDDMDRVYDDAYDAVVIASPIYTSGLTGPLVGLASRFQARYAARRFLGRPMPVKPKNGALILVGGGDGSKDHAVKLAEWMFRQLGAHCPEENRVYSLKTDQLPAFQDLSALALLPGVARRLIPH